MGKISIKYLAEDLRDVRDQTKNRRKNCANKVLERLGYTRNKSISIEQFDALLIRAIDQSLGISRDADVLLMAFGLMRGYYYGEIALIGDRRKKYLAESNYLETHPRKQIPYADATKEEKEKLEDNLRKAEDVRIKSLARFLSDQDFPQYIDNNIQPIAMPQPSYILLKDKPVEHEGPEDDDISPEGGSNAAEGQKDTHSEAKAQPGASVSPSDPRPHEGIHIGPISINPILNINWKNIKVPSLLAVVTIVAMLLLQVFSSSTSSTGDTFFVESLTVVKGDIIMSPNTYYGLVVADSLDKTSGSVLSYVSSDPSVVEVGEHNGMLQAPASHPDGGLQTADITITDENGATTTKTITVDFDLPNNNSNSGPGHSIQLDDFVPDFSVTQKIRIAGDTEWHNYVDAKVGDELEIQFEYRNTSENEHINVAVRDILPANLGYIPGSTTIYTTQTPPGLKKEDGIVGNGIYIGTYGSKSNAWVRFRVRVVDINLADEATGLVNWSQVCVDGVTLQDFATVRVNK